MEPVTHVLTGACLARAGLNRKAAYATMAMAIAAELPDIDTVWSLRGPVEGFAHHRGITHTLLGIPFEACFLVALFWAAHRWRARSKSAELAPVRWGVLFCFAVLALLSHILLDYTNNYGVRPFYPFDSRWYAGSFVFIFDPVLFVLLLTGLTMPALFGLIGQEVTGKRDLYHGAGWARAALLGVVVLYGFRAYEHQQALNLAGLQTLRAPATSVFTYVPSGPQDETSPVDQGPVPTPSRALLQPQRSLASPDPFNPFRWYTVTDFGPVYQLGIVDTTRDSFEEGQVLNKLVPSARLLAAKRSYLGRVYLDWSPMPWLTMSETEGGTSPQNSGRDSIVTFQDPRFMGATFLNRGRVPPITGTVEVDASGTVVEETLNGRVQH